MKLKTSVAAVLFALSAGAAWAGDTGQSKDDLGGPGPEATAVQPSGSQNEELAWKFVNGQVVGSENQSSTDQAAASADQSHSDQAAKTDDQSGSEQTARSEEQGASDQSAVTEGQSQGDQAKGSEDKDQAASSEEQDGGDQSAMTEGQGESGQAAAAEEQSSEQAATAEEQSSEQTAASEEQSGDDQSARSEEQEQSDQSANSDNPAADLKDKVVVIIPKGWKGSLPDLIAALEQSPDAKDIVIVQQGEPQASNNEPDDSYSATSKPVVNRQ